MASHLWKLQMHLPCPSAPSAPLPGAPMLWDLHGKGVLNMERMSSGLSFSKQSSSNPISICNEKWDLNPISDRLGWWWGVVCFHMLIHGHSGLAWPPQGGVSLAQRRPQPTGVDSLLEWGWFQGNGHNTNTGSRQEAGEFNHLEAWPCHCSCWGNLSQSVCHPGPDVFPSWHLGLTTADEDLPGEQSSLH